MKLREIQQSLQFHVNELRSIQRLIVAADFEKAYTNATDHDKQIVDQYIMKGERLNAVRWLAIQTKKELDIEELNIRELRKLAVSLGIAGYNVLSKASLLSEIKQHERHREPNPRHSTPVRADAGVDLGSGCTDQDSGRYGPHRLGDELGGAGEQTGFPLEGGAFI